MTTREENGMILDLLALTPGAMPGFSWVAVAARVYGWPDDSPLARASDAGLNYHFLRY